MATKITQDGFDVELGREPESKDCQLSHYIHYFSADRFVNQIEYYSKKLMLL